MEELDLLTLERARRGDRTARLQLVRTYQAPVYALASRMLVRRSAHVDDVAQESMLKVLEALPRFDPKGRAKLSTWILTVTVRTAIDALRRAKKVVPLSATAEETSETEQPEPRLEARDLGRRVEAAMVQLSDDQRAILVLRAYHDLDYHEIAEALGVEEGTVKSRLSRARSALREVMERRGVRHA
jgi:RNA polymerase sigma-70 factor (ECF subfamily)